MSHGTATAPVRVSLIEEDRVLSLVLDRPKGNVLDREMMEHLEAALSAHVRDPHLRMVLLRGAGGRFSYGASVSEHQADQAPEMLACFHRLIRTVARFPVPIAALVEGPCLGGAFEVALCCHLVFGTADAGFGCPEIKLGVFPPVLAAVGHLRLPGALAERMLLTGAKIDAAGAKASGLLTEILPAGEDHQAWLLAWYREHIEPLSAFALREATAAGRLGSGLLVALDGPLAELERRYLARLLPSHDGNEGITAFLERRAPRWEDL